MSTRSESERRVAEALRARVTAGGPGGAGPRRSPAADGPVGGWKVGSALLVALLAGGVLGMALALLSLLMPGLLPTLG